MTIWTNEIARISTAQARAQFKPATFARMTHVPLTHGEASFVVELVRAPGFGCVKDRVWFRCPCGALAVTVAIAYGRLCCRSCHRWRPRGYGMTNVMAPNVRQIGVEEKLTPSAG